MRQLISIILLLQVFLLVSGCALGRKEWPQATESQDRFTLKLIEGVRDDNCLILDINVGGSPDRLWRASIQYELVGSGEGQGCEGCPFVPRDAVHFTRDNSGFILQGNTLHLSICSLEPGERYRFRVVGKSELPTMPLVYTDVYTAEP